eukprot:1141147-Pelagomonas_calceolata.AAC.1
MLQAPLAALPPAHFTDTSNKSHPISFAFRTIVFCPCPPACLHKLHSRLPYLQAFVICKFHALANAGTNVTVILSGEALASYRVNF